MPLPTGLTALMRSDVHLLRVLTRLIPADGLAQPEGENSRAQPVKSTRQRGIESVFVGVLDGLRRDTGVSSFLFRQLRQEGHIPETAALPRPRWKMKVREEWRIATGRTREVKRPRHSVDEVAAIFAALPQGDPRLRLLVELAAELRAGQAVRARRSDLHLTGGGFALGRFIVRGAGKKLGRS